MGEDDASTTVLHKCTHCGREFTRPGGLGKHLRTCGPLARPPDAFSCLWCNQSFKQPSGLGKHKQSCPKRPCSEPSDSTCSNNESVSTHVDSIVCPKCKRSFKSRDGFGKHLLSCNGEQQHHDPTVTYSCPLCPRSFSGKRGLSLHQRHCLAPSPTAEADESQQVVACKTPEPADRSDFNLFSAAGPLDQHSARGSFVDLSSPEMSSADSVPLMHSPTNTPNDKTYSSLRLAPRMTFLPASAKKSWPQADETMELMLQAECPAFNKMSTNIMMSNLIDVIKTYFSKPPRT